MEVIYSALRGLGFEGTLLKVLMKEIITESHLSQFHMFIMDNDGKYRTKLHLVHAFALHMQEQRSYKSSAEFANEYITAGVERRKIVLYKLFDGSLNKVQMVQVYDMIEAGLTLEELFDAVKPFRKQYSIAETITLMQYKN